MRYIIITTFFLGVLSISQAQSSHDISPTHLYEASHALLIGNADYQIDWPRLPGVKKDLKAVKEALEIHGFQVDVGLDYSKTQMDSAFSAFIAAHGDTDSNRLLFYYAGHGETIKTSYGEGLSYLVPVDAPASTHDVNLFQGKSMEMTQIEIYAKRIQSKHALFLFDACFAGSIFGQSRAYNEALNYQLSQPVRQFITSGEADEVVPDESVFRREFVRALISTAADENADGYLTGSELGTFLQDQVVSGTNGRQHPQFGKIRNPSLDKGEFVILLNPETHHLSTRSVFKPSVGKAATLERYGQLEVKTEMKGILSMNEEQTFDLSAAQPLNLASLASGYYQLSFVGNENWKGSVKIEAGKTTTIEIKPYVNKASRNMFMPMSYVEAGTFMMGDPDGGPDHNVVHAVTLPAFEIGAYEVTVGQFSQFVEQTGYVTELERMSGTHLVLNGERGLQKQEGMNWRYGPDGILVENMEKPVVFVSWNDAMAFANWMSENVEGTYRLPTEAEWEFAAQGGIRKTDIKTDSSQITEFSKHERLQKLGNRNTRPNEIGVFHMQGGLSEWCLDWYDKNYYRQATKNSPMGPNQGEMKVIRGGSWIANTLESKPTFRKKTYPNLCSFSDGFRVVRVLEK